LSWRTHHFVNIAKIDPDKIIKDYMAKNIK